MYRLIALVGNGILRIPGGLRASRPTEGLRNGFADEAVVDGAAEFVG